MPSPYKFAVVDRLCIIPKLCLSALSLFGCLIHAYLEQDHQFLLKSELVLGKYAHDI